MNKDSKIYIAGHRGMVGSAIWRKLEAEGYTNLIGKTSNEVDLRDQKAVTNFFHTEKPEVVIDAAARVGGILANSEYPYQFLMENLQIQNNLIDTAHITEVEKFIFLGSSCIYPKLAPQPLKEEYLLTDSLEPTNEWYAIAKIAGVKACEAIRKQFGKDYVSLMPTNLYGTHDNFDLKTSHVLPAMIRKFHEAKEQNSEFVEIWGTGSPLREFMFADDLADACYLLMQSYDEKLFVNVGVGHDISIKDLALLVKKVIGYDGELRFNTDKPDGTPRKLMDVSTLNSLGFKPKVELEEGIGLAYSDFLSR